MKVTLKTYFRLFLTTFYLSAFTFGGGYVIVTLMKKKFVDELKWIDEEEMLDIVAMGQSAPGPMAVNTSLLVGKKIAGIKGAMCSVLGTVLPPFIVISIVAFFYSAFREQPVVSAVLLGMQAGVAAVIADVVFQMGGKVVKGKDAFSIVIMIAAFAIVMLFKINVVFIILASGLLGAARIFISRRLAAKR